MKKNLLVLMGFLGIIIAGSPAFAFEVYLPHLTGDSVGWADHLQADNNGTSEASFTLAVYEDGVAAATQSFTVPGKSKILLSVKNMISATGTTGIITYTDQSLAFRLSYEYQSGGIAEFFLGDELNASIALYFSNFSSVLSVKGAIIANLTGTARTVTLYALGRGETLGEYSTSIGPFGKISGSPSGWFTGVADWQVEKIIAVTDAACLDGLAIGSDNTLEHMVFTSAQKVIGFDPGEAVDPDPDPDPDSGNTDTSTFTTVFYEGFTTDGNGWDEGDEADYYNHIYGGWYYMDNYCNDKGYYWVIPVAGIDQKKNFTIETQLKNVLSIEEDRYGLTFGYGGSGNCFDFSLTPYGYFGVFKYENKTKTSYAWAESDAINLDDDTTNILRVEKLGSTLYFYINDVAVHSMAFESFFGSSMGFHLYNDQRIGANYLKVTMEP